MAIARMEVNMDSIFILIILCVFCFLLSILVAFQLSKKYKRQQFMLILNDSKQLLIKFVLAAIIISVLIYHFLGMSSIPIIYFIMLSSLTMPVSITSIRYSLSKR